jgi:putative membrane protein
VTIGAINVANEIFSLNSLYLVNNPRSGASVAIQRILPEMNFQNFLTIVASILIASSLTTVFILYFAKKFHKLLLKVNYSILNIIMILFLSSLVFIFTSFIGLLAFFTCGAVGILAAELNVRRSHCMGCLLVPSMIFFYGATNTVLSFLFI